MLEEDSGGSVLQGFDSNRSIDAMTFFSGLDAGEHTVSIWVRTPPPNAAHCIVGPRLNSQGEALGQDVFVEEIQV